MWSGIAAMAGKLVSDWLKGRQEITKAKVESEVQRIQKWEDRMAEGSMTSWKDEFWCLVLAVPMVMVFFPEMVPHIKSGFEALAEMPEWYRWSLMLAIGASFGFRGFDKFMAKPGSVGKTSGTGTPSKAPAPGDEPPMFR